MGVEGDLGQSNILGKLFRAWPTDLADLSTQTVEVEAAATAETHNSQTHLSGLLKEKSLEPYC